MIQQFDISTNRIPHGLLEPAEREALEAAAKVLGARVEYYSDAWRVCTPIWNSSIVYRVHLPAAVEPPKQEPPKQEPQSLTEYLALPDDEKMKLVCKAEPLKQEPEVEYWRRNDGPLVCKTTDGIIVEVNGYPALIEDEPLLPHLWQPITAAEYTEAKAKASGKPADAAPKPTRIEPLNITGGGGWYSAITKINELVDAVNELRKGGGK